MYYDQIVPDAPLSRIIKSIWWIDSEGDAAIETQKIVPDGYPEFIIHLGDTFEINISGRWETQAKFLLAGQIRKHFHLRNTGVAKMLGIKFQPATVNRLFGLDMSELMDDVIAVDQTLGALYELATELSGCSDFSACKSHIEEWFDNRVIQPSELNPVDKAVQELIATNGNVRLNQLYEELGVSERTLERQFKKVIGLSPKFYSRIIRFTYIFDQIKQGKEPWLDITYDSGYYDQAHFIKNFKEFTGESPSAYGFEEKNMANFFLFKEQ
ncbi:AraC family transcriptional regulator [Fulvivirga lutimaris]|uniref:AraC family transcriptional regulator n=1 Tax=Fulvivirga lutimaris TaxID=1819566 RepID=UPI0012BCFA94|nr:AraC family transcriptional regulator [Fulvivirga lutimaris]MTI39208.1 AraC family transcriptional regulator [Fulvivirga lutimaris]